MIENISVEKVFRDNLAASMGLNLYSKIIDWVKITDVSTNLDFQRTFNSFYIVRRNQQWRDIYYSYFESVKGINVSFEDVICYLYEKTGNIEPSFSSKLLATVNPDKPIWDQYVIKNLNKELTGKTKEERLQNAIKIYTEIEDWYSAFLKTEKSQEIIRDFDKALPDYSYISDTKKIDCILWSLK